MKIINVHILVLFFLAFTLSCNETQQHKLKEDTEAAKPDPVKMAHVEVKIEGMTCEIGCARLIESKLYKTEGVTYANVSFENKNGKISFDENELTNDELKAVIEQIAGGDLYTVVQIVEVAEFPEENELNM